MMVLGDKLRAASIAEVAFYWQGNDVLTDMVNWWIKVI
ncbi:hypothetical protein DFO75_3357 [Bacillus safensis]|nr:hypothetical protein DFO75_3357 [Bacillus safensis]